MRHDWPVKNAIVDLPIKMKGNSKHTSVNSLSRLGAQNKDLGAALQTLLTEVSLRLRRRLHFSGVLYENLTAHINVVCMIYPTQIVTDITAVCPSI